MYSYCEDGHTHSGEDEAIGRSKFQQPGFPWSLLLCSLCVVCHNASFSRTIVAEPIDRDFVLMNS